MVLHSAKGPKEQKLLCFRVLLESPTSRLYRIKKVQITKGNRFVINLKHSLALLSLILKMTISDCIFVSKREFNGTISSKFLPLPHNYAVSREKMAKINNKSTKTAKRKIGYF